MKIQELTTEYGVLQYSVMEGYIMLTEYRGRDIKLTIPVNIEGLPVTIIGKKAFLAARELKELVLPECVAAIQDWAFASCRSLETITLPRKKIEIGQGILKDCARLRRIITVGMETGNDSDTNSDSDANTDSEANTDSDANSDSDANPDSDVNADSDTAAAVSYLLAAVMNKLDAFYLFDPLAAGSEGWLEQWDARMLALIGQEDAEGFSKMLLCGEEDYGSRDNNLDYYVEQKRRFKVRLAMLRLMNDIGLKPSARDRLLAYLQAHSKGGSSEETWKVVLEENGDDRQYYQLLLDNGCITAKNIDAVLEDMGERHTEMKAFLMNYQSTRFKKEDAFAALEFEL